MDKIIYSFSYQSENTKVVINRKFIEIRFLWDYSSLVYINRINQVHNVIIASPVLERLEDNSLLTADGINIIINKEKIETEIRFLEDDSYLISRGDGSILFRNNGQLLFNDDDRDLKLQPNVIRRKELYSYYREQYEFDYLRFKSLAGGIVNSTANINLLKVIEEIGAAEAIGEGGQYNIVVDSELSQEVLIPLVADYSYNNLDTIFGEV